MNIFLVLSPLQLINALEAKAYFGTHNNILIVLRDTSLFYPISMYKEFINEREWERIIYLSTYHHERVKKVGKLHWFYLRWRQRWRIDKLLRSLEGVDKLFIGRYREPITRHIANSLPHKKLYLLDDGTDTLLINELRRDFRSHLPTSLKEKLSIALLRIRNQQAQNLTFFTTYTIDVQPYDELVLHSYPNLRQQYADSTPSDEVWFLGQPLPLDGFTTEATYLSYLQAIADHYRNQNFVYLPHPRELDADVARIAELLGCEVRRLALLVEFALIKVRPKEVVSFMSSALPNCHALFGETLQLTSVYIKPEDITHYQGFVQSIYQYFRKESDASFRVLEIEPLP